MPEDAFGIFGEGMERELPEGDPALAIADRALQAMAREFKDNKQWPRFVVIVETPPEGEVFVKGLPGSSSYVAIASQADDEIDTHRLLLVAALSVRRAMSGETHARAVKMWDDMQAEFAEKFKHWIAQPPAPPSKAQRQRTQRARRRR